MPDWGIVDRWAALGPRASWSVIDDFIAKAQPVLADLRGRLSKLIKRWDGKLSRLGGDPCRRNWKEFRPLRLEREQDWSDWLHHLLQTGNTNLAASLFPGVDSDSVRTIKREDPTADNERRADLTITWNAGGFTHVEVKVGDRNFAKTFETAQLLEKKSRGSWKHFILFPEADLNLWLTTAENRPAGAPEVEPKTWVDVAICLRRALLQPCDDLLWQAFAIGLCGAVEQRLLGHPRLNDDLDNQFERIETISALGSLVNVMEAALDGQS